MSQPRSLPFRATAGFLALAAVVPACNRAQVQSTLPLRRVVIYRNGVGYFERAGTVRSDTVEFQLRENDVGDFLGSLAVMERDGSTVRSAAFPVPPAARPGSNQAPPPDDRRAVRLQLEGNGHDVVVGYTVETPIWRPSYRLVLGRNARPQVQAWGVVQNTTGEDWRDVRLSLVAGAPVSFRNELALAVIPPRPLVTDRGNVIDAVPQSETVLAQTAPSLAVAEEPSPEPMADDDASAEGGSGRAMAQSARMRRPVALAAPAAPPAPAPAFAPRTRNTNSLAAVATQGGDSRYDMAAPVTVPNHSATMVLLLSRDVPGETSYLFAPDGGVSESFTHPFHVARFENRTGAMLERGPLSIFEDGAYLGQGMLEALPDGAGTTVPFALERGVTVETSAQDAIEGARLVRAWHDEITLERYRVQRMTYRVRSGLDHAVTVKMRHALDGTGQLLDPPQGTENANGAALVPVPVDARAAAERVVRTRWAFTIRASWEDDVTAEAVEAFLRDGHPSDAQASALRTAVQQFRELRDMQRQRDGLEQRRADLSRTSEETRQNLEAVRRIATAEDLRRTLTERLTRVSAELDQTTRRIVELDTQMSERRVRLAETVRSIEIDTSAH